MDDSSSPETPQWRPLAPIDRRVAGVLVEKAKTTPAGYPMTVNAICTGANQKNNRDPEMSLTPEQVQDSLDRLREYGAVGEIQGDGRVAKYRHYLYKWLGVEKVELAVMAELLLRGAQTIGDLRARAARMEPIADQSALRPILASLMAKNLVIALTPEGRGQIVTHALYEPTELAHVRAKFRDHPGDAAPTPMPATARPSSFAAPAPPSTPPPSTPLAASSPVAAAVDREEMRRLSREVEELREEVHALRRELTDLRALLS